MEKVYCINLDRRPDRWAQTLLECERVGLSNVERVSAVDGRDLQLDDHASAQFKGRIGCAKSHLNVLERIRDLSLPATSKVLILEDDVQFTSNGSFMDLRVPEDWDMLFLGSNTGKPQRIPVESYPDVVRLYRPVTAHAYIVNPRSVDVLIPLVRASMERWTRNTHDTAVDVVYAEWSLNHQVYGFRTTYATQRPSLSDIEQRFVDYRHVIR
jgi:GR25 family glycosyltransferase involved in LPS biosynthesis